MKMHERHSARDHVCGDLCGEMVVVVSPFCKTNKNDDQFRFTASKGCCHTPALPLCQCNLLCAMISCVITLNFLLGNCSSVKSPRVKKNMYDLYLDICL